jgi:hypothetical protein
MLDVCYAANSGAKIDQTTDVLESADLLELLKNMSDIELTELEDELNFAHFTGLFGPLLSDITCDSNGRGRNALSRTPSRAA